MKNLVKMTVLDFVLQIFSEVHLEPCQTSMKKTNLVTFTEEILNGKPHFLYSIAYKK